MIPAAAPALFATIARAIAPRRPVTVSQWADAHRVLSPKASAWAGPWRTSSNPPLREPMDCLSARSTVHDVVLMFPIQFGKTEVAINLVGYTIDHDPCPILACLPGEPSMNGWIAQKLSTLIEQTPRVRDALTSQASRDSANQRAFKEFAGGQIFIEHAGSPQRLKSKSVRRIIVDELDEFAASLRSGDDPISLIEGRTSAFPSNYQRLYISTPSLAGVSRIDALYQASDRRRFHIACPHCAVRQPLEWSGLHWDAEATACWYACRECGACIEEHQKTTLIAEADRRSLAGDTTIGWVPENPEPKVRGYTINALYYPFGLGPRWLDLVHAWRAAQNDPAKLKTFVNDRLAETWEDPAMRAVKHNIIADRVEAWPLRKAPPWVLALTIGIDTQDNRLAVQLVGWGRGMSSWILDYIELPGDPADDAVWAAVTDLYNRPIEHALGGLLRVDAGAIDLGGHRTEAVKDYVRQKRVRRLLPIFGAVPNNAPVLSKGKLQEINWRGLYDKRGVTIHHVGTVGIKHMLYGRLSTDADKQPDARLVRFSEDLPPEYFAGLVSETYNPSKNRFDKKRGARNEPLDTWVYAYAATHHPELRLHRWTKADWDAREARLRASADPPPSTEGIAPRETSTNSEEPSSPRERDLSQRRKPGGFATNW